MVLVGFPEVWILGEPHNVEVGVPVNSKPIAGAAGKVCLKVKPVNEMAALLVMVNLNLPVALPELLVARLNESGLGINSMPKLGAGTVTVKLIAAAVALGAWLLLRVTAGLVRTPGAVT
jgi:hypothetical protein